MRRRYELFPGYLTQCLVSPIARPSYQLCLSPFATRCVLLEKGAQIGNSLRFHCCNSFLKRQHLRKILYDLSERHDHQRDRHERRQRNRDQQSKAPQTEREVFHPINVSYYSVDVGGRREVLRIRPRLISAPLAIEAIPFELTPDLDG